jgi:hypothetical protein
MEVMGSVASILKKEQDLSSSSCNHYEVSAAYQIKSNQNIFIPTEP